MDASVLAMAAARPWAWASSWASSSRRTNAGPRRDRAMQAALRRERDPDWAGRREPVGPCPQFGLRHVRDCVVLPAALLTIAVPWLAALLVTLGHAAAAFLVARIRVDRSGLRVFAAGFLRVMDVPAAAIDAATPRTSRRRTMAGGVTGPRRHHGDAGQQRPRRRRRPLGRATAGGERRQRRLGGQRGPGAVPGGGPGPARRGTTGATGCARP